MQAGSRQGSCQMCMPPARGAAPQVRWPAVQRIHAPAVPGGVRQATQAGVPHHAVQAQQRRHGQLGGGGWGAGGGGAGTSSALVHRKTCRLGSASADSQGWRPLLERNRTYSCTRRHQCQLDAPTRLQGPAPPCAHLDGVHSVGGAVQPPVQPEDEEPGIEGSERKAHQRHGRLGPHHALHRRAGRQVGPVPRQISCGVHRVHTRTLAAQPALRGLVPERVPAPSTTPRHPGASRCCRPGQRLVQACLRGYGCRATAAPGPAGSACWTQKRPAPGARGW